MNRSLILTAFLFAALGAQENVLAETERTTPIQVVTSTAYFADLVREVGGNRVEVKPVASPKFNVHFVQPKPSDIRNLRKADLYVFAGLDLEAWSDPLVEAAGRSEFFRGGNRSVDLSRGVKLLDVPQKPLSRADGDIHLFGNPHYAMDPRNAKILSGTLAEKLSEIDPSGTAYYRSRSEDFLRRLDLKKEEWKKVCAHCAGREVYSYHQDIGYLADFLGLKVSRFLEPKPGIPPTPKHLKDLREYAKTAEIKAILMPSYFPRGAAERLAERIGAAVVLVAQNPGEIGGVDGILELFDHDIQQIAEALGS